MVDCSRLLQGTLPCSTSGMDETRFAEQFISPVEAAGLAGYPAIQAGPVLDHPSARLLGRYASNEMGRQGKKRIATHLDQCCECKQTVLRSREVSRRFRDFERAAFAAYPRE